MTIFIMLNKKRLLLRTKRKQLWSILW